LTPSVPDIARFAGVGEHINAELRARRVALAGRARRDMHADRFRRADMGVKDASPGLLRQPPVSWEGGAVPLRREMRAAAPK